MKIAKDKVWRTTVEDFNELTFIKPMVLAGSNTAEKDEADVLHQLIKMYKDKKIGDPSFSQKSPVMNPIQMKIDEYNSLLEDRTAEVKRWKKRTEIACEKANLDVREIIELVQ